VGSICPSPATAIPDRAGALSRCPAHEKSLGRPKPPIPGPGLPRSNRAEAKALRGEADCKYLGCGCTWLDTSHPLFRLHRSCLCDGKKPAIMAVAARDMLTARSSGWPYMKINGSQP
jgi:hypothetical protein